MAKTLQQYPTGQAQYRVEFDYLARPFVIVTLINSEDQTLNKVLTVGTDYTFLNATTINLLASQTGFDRVQVNRQTSSTPLVSFQDGSVLTASDLSTAEIQSIHIAEEARDQTAAIAQTYSEQAIEAAENAQEVLDKILAMQSAGYDPVGTFEGGATVSLPNQTVRYGSGTSVTFWRWDGVLPKTVAAGSTPTSTGGIGPGKWVDVTDMTLRGQLAAADGFKLVGEVDNIAALRSVEPTAEGQVIKLKQHTAGSGLGGGYFRAKMSAGSTSDNNGTNIRTSGGRLWVRENSEIGDPCWYGALCRSDVNDSIALRAAHDNHLYTDCKGRTYYINDTVYWTEVKGRRYVCNFNLRAMESLPNGRPMIRLGNGKFVDSFLIDGGLQTVGTGTIGLLWQGGHEGTGGAVTNGFIQYTGSQGLYISADYDNFKGASRGLVDNITFLSCGGRGSGNGRATLGCDFTNDFTFSNIRATDCNWGVYMRNDMNLANGQRVSNNVMRHMTLRGGGRTNAQRPDAQGISAGFQENLHIFDVTVSDFADNAIDMQYCDNSLVDQWRANNCKDGVFMGDRSCRGHKITNGVANGCDRAIRLLTDGSIPMQNQTQLIDIVIENVRAYSCNWEGFQIRNVGKSATPAAVMRNVRLTNCSVDNSSTYNSANQGVGLLLIGGESVVIENFYSFNNKNEAIYVEDCEQVKIVNAQLTNSDRGNTGKAGICLVTAQRTTVDNCNMFGSSASTAIEVKAGSHNSALRFNRWRGVANGITVAAGSSNLVQTDNIQW